MSSKTHTLEQADIKTGLHNLTYLDVLALEKSLEVKGAIRRARKRQNRS